MNKPIQVSISVVIPAYNGESYLADAIESVLAQSLQPEEIIIVDDGSTDTTPAIIRRYAPRVRYIQQGNSGTAAARNNGVKSANGFFLAFLDQDDLWEPPKLEMQMNAIRQNTIADVIFTHLQQFYSPELPAETMANIFCPEKSEPGYLPSAMLIKREALFRVGLFECQWQIGEWTNWFVRAKEAGLKIQTLPEVLVKRRLHCGNKGLLQRNRRAEYAQILKASLDRRRAKGDI